MRHTNQKNSTNLGYNIANIAIIASREWLWLRRRHLPIPTDRNKICWMLEIGVDTQMGGSPAIKTELNVLLDCYFRPVCRTTAIQLNLAVHTKPDWFEYRNYCFGPFFLSLFGIGLVCALILKILYASGNLFPIHWRDCWIGWSHLCVKQKKTE